MDSLDAIRNPLGFAEYVLGFNDLYDGREQKDGTAPDWQGRALVPLTQMTGRVKTLLTTPNGAGKSSRVVATSALWVPFCFAKGRVAITTASSMQLNEQIIPAIEEQIPKLGWPPSVKSPYYRVTTPGGGSITAVVTDDAGRVEGLHEKLPDSPLLWVIDEGKSVPDSIYDGGKQVQLHVATGNEFPWVNDRAFVGMCQQCRIGI